MSKKRTAPHHKSNIPDIEVIDLDREYPWPDCDNEVSATEEEPANDSPSRHIAGFPKRINWHIVFMLAVVLCIGLVIFRLSNWGTRVPSFFDPNADYDDGDFIEVLDNMVDVPFEYRQDTDGSRTVVVLGNYPFADERDAEDGVINLVSRMTDATIYNCSVADSHLAASEETFYVNREPMDAFNLYWLTLLITMRNTSIYEKAFEAMGDSAPADARYAYDTLSTLDFQNVDVLAIMYDATDYLEGRPLHNPNNATDIQTFAGNLYASLELLCDTFPHMRIIVMSPTYAYYVAEDGEYISSDIHKVDGNSLSTYAVYLEQIAYPKMVSYLDNLYGTVNEVNAEDYLLDHLHLNAAGRQKLAERFVYALEYFD